MKYRVDLVSRASVVVEATDEYSAIELAEKYANSNPSFIPTFEFDGEGIEETNDEADI